MEQNKLLTFEKFKENYKKIINQKIISQIYNLIDEELLDLDNENNSNLFLKITQLKIIYPKNNNEWKAKYSDYLETAITYFKENEEEFDLKNYHKFNKELK